MAGLFYLHKIPKVAGAQEEVLQATVSLHFTPYPFCCLSKELLSGCTEFMSNCVIK